MTLQSINPATGHPIKTYPELSGSEASAHIDNAHAAFVQWRETSFSHRTAVLKRVAQVLLDRKDEYARLMALEMGKPVRDGGAEIEKCAWVCTYYADHAEEMLAPETVATDAERSFVAFQPLGVILAVMPWNYPFWQVFRFAAPALMAGNGAILKHAANVPGCALAIESAFREAGLPADLFKSLLISSKHMEPVIAHPCVRAITLTGSTEAGRKVAATAGKLLKKTVLELGGSDPYIVLADADLDKAAEACAASRLLNSGQSCVAAKRFIVVNSVREAFEKKLVAAMAGFKMGDPLDENVHIGPQARVDLRDELHTQVALSIEKGARPLLGGTLPPGEGAFYPPTVLTDVTKGMPAYDEETFGPVAAIIPAENEAEAIQMANDTPFGLGAAVFTADRARGEQIAVTQLEAGNCFVNTFVKSDPRLPFGGIKESGYGRELSHYGIKEFVNIKTVYVA